MNKVISLIKRFRFDRLVVVFLAGVLLLVSTACSGAANAGVAGTDRPGVSGEGRINRQNAGQQTELYDPIQPREGGMNEYSDVDPRVDTSGAEAKTRQLIDTTERNVIDQTDDVGTNTRRILEKKGENARDFGGDVKEGARELGRQTRETANTAREGVRQAGEDFSKNSRRAADAVQDQTGEAIDRTQRGLSNAQDATERAARDTRRSAESTGESLKDRANDLIDQAQKTVDRGQDAVDQARR
jgi:ElaB/YqjD/DUF883 family membrane-anchored ribosome-binding protein